MQYVGILSQTRKMKRKIEIAAVEQIRIRGEYRQIFCSVCQKFAEFFSTAQPAAHSFHAGIFFRNNKN